jgi:hypothetical protein
MALRRRSKSNRHSMKRASENGGNDSLQPLAARSLVDRYDLGDVRLMFALQVRGRCRSYASGSFTLQYPQFRGPGAREAHRVRRTPTPASSIDASPADVVITGSTEPSRRAGRSISFTHQPGWIVECDRHARSEHDCHSCIQLVHVVGTAKCMETCRDRRLGRRATAAWTWRPKRETLCSQSIQRCSPTRSRSR